MEFTICEQTEEYHPKIGMVLPGRLVEYEGHIYQKFDASKIGQGINMEWPTNYSILINVRYGRIRAIHSDTRVCILIQGEYSKLHRITKKIEVLDNHLKIIG